MTEQDIKEILSRCTFHVENNCCEKAASGGQHTNGPIRGIRITHPDFSISVFYGEHRSMHENKEEALKLFELALRITIKNQLNS